MNLFQYIRALILSRRIGESLRRLSDERGRYLSITVQDVSVLVNCNSRKRLQRALQLLINSGLHCLDIGRGQASIVAARLKLEGRPSGSDASLPRELLNFKVFDLDSVTENKRFWDLYIYERL